MARIVPYAAVGICNSVWSTERHLDENEKRNVKHILEMIDGALWFATLDLPVKLVVLPELGLHGAPDEFLDYEHVKASKELFGPIPDETTEALGEACKKHGFYLIGQKKVTDPDLMKDRFFNCSFVIDPEGEIICKAYKNAVFPREHSCTPFDIWDVFVEKYGDDPKKLLEALFPVARTEIGNIGLLICEDGTYPEASRALAVNGAEIIYRPSYPEPWIGNGMFEVQNRAHAIFNTCYVITPTLGPVYTTPGRGESGYKDKDWKESVPFDCSGSTAMILDYRGLKLSQHIGRADSFVSAIIDIEQLRYFRVTGLWQNLIKNLRVDVYSQIYKALEAMGGCYPKNLGLNVPPMKHADTDELMRWLVNRMVEMGVYTPPDGWEPWKIKKEVLEVIDKAKKSTKSQELKSAIIAR